VARPKHQKNQRGRMASISRLVLFGKDWLWLSFGYVMLLPTITIRLGSGVNGSGIGVTVGMIVIVGGGPKGRMVDPVLWRTVPMPYCSHGV